MLHAAFADFLMDVYGDVDAATAAYARAAALVNSRGQVDVLVSCLWSQGGMLHMLSSPLCHLVSGQLRHVSVRRCAGCGSKRSCVQCRPAGLHPPPPPARLSVVMRPLSQLDPLNIITLGRFAYFKHR
jgi:hypothetical protein